MDLRFFCEIFGEAAAAADSSTPTLKPLILGETRLALKYIEFALEAHSLAETAELLTTVDGLYRLSQEYLVLSGELGTSLSRSPLRLSPLRLSPLHRRKALQQIISTNNALFLLREEIHNAPPKHHPYALDRLLRFLDTARTWQNEERTITRIIDDVGQVLLGNDRTAQLIQLLVAYEERCGELGHGETFSALERFCQQLRIAAGERGAKIQQALPQIFLVAPSSLSPLLAELLILLSRLTPVSFVLDESLANSLGGTIKREKGGKLSTLDYSTSLSNVLQHPLSKITLISLPARGARREVLLDLALGGGATSQLSDQSLSDGLAVWSCKDAREEVQRVAAVISGRLREKRANLRDFQVFCFELEHYRSLLVEEFQRSNLPLMISPGPLLSHTLAAEFFFTLLKAFREPNLENTLALLAHPLCRQIPNEELSEEPSEEPRADKLVQIVTHLDAAALQRFISSYFLGEPTFPELFAQFAKVLAHSGLSAASHQEIITARETARWVERQITTWQEFHQSQPTVEMLARILRQNFNALRRSARELPWESFSQLRILFRLVRAVTLEYLHPELTAASSDIEAWQSELRLAVESYELEVSWQEEAVHVAEFNEVRFVSRPGVFVLGATESRYGQWLKEQGTNQGDSIEQFCETLREQGGERGRILEGPWLFARAWSQAQEIVFSLPRTIAGEEQTPAALLQGLGGVFAGKTMQGKLALLAQPDKAANGVTGKSPVVAMLQARAQHGFNEYDCALGEEALLQLEKISPKNFLGGGNYRFSVSALELLARNPFQFFLENVLQLKPRYLPREQVIEAQLGRIIHRALQKFFEQSGREGQLQRDFFGAVREICALAELEFSNDIFAWETHPYLRYCRQRLLEVSASMEENQNPLLAALWYQKNFITSWPWKLELAFGGKDYPPLLVTAEGGTLAVTGVIDRVDAEGEREGKPERVLAVWDYKTGKPPTISEVNKGLSLQVPLYAAFLAQHFGPGALPQRGGIVDLSKPARGMIDSPGVKSCRRGVVLEVLALAARGEELAPERAVKRVETALNKLHELHAVLQRKQYSPAAEESPEYLGAFDLLYPGDIERLAFKSGSEGRGRRGGRGGKSTALPPLEEAKQLSWEYLPKAADSAPQIVLSPEQQAACTLDHPVVLRAGAGSGKTAVIRSRVLKLIARGADVRSILAITFTEKAAEEILSRIAQALEQCIASNSCLGEELSLQQREYFLRARIFLPQAQFGTIHGLARLIINMDRQLSGVAPRMRVLAPGEQQALLEQASSVVFKDQTPAPLLSGILRENIKFRQLQQEVQYLVARRKWLKELRESYGKANQQEQLIEELERRKRTDLGVAIARLQESCGNWQRECERWLREGEGPKKFSSEKRKNWEQGLSEIEKLLEQIANSSAEESLTQMTQCQQFFQRGKAENQQRVSSKNPVNYWKEISETLDSWFTKHNCLFSSREREMRGLELSKLVLDLAVAVEGEYQRLKAKQEVLDFDDLLFIARETLLGVESAGVNTELGQRRNVQRQQLIERLRRRFAHVMVDEFQDTDSTQWEIIRAVLQENYRREASSSGDSSATALIVGDPQQAIYRFRGGENTVFEEASAELIARGGIALSLVDNYRSAEPVVDFINAFFPPLFAADFAEENKKVTPGAVRGQVMQSKSGLESRFPALQFLFPEERPSDQELDALEEETSGENSEAQRVARFIETTLENWPAGKTVRGREENGAKIAVLTRTALQAERLAIALAAKDVPHQLFRSRGFFESDEVKQMLALLLLLKDPLDNIALVAVLRSVFGGFSDRALVGILAHLQGDWREFFAKTDWSESEICGEVSAPGAQVREFLEFFKRLSEEKKWCKSSDLLHSAIVSCSLETSYREVGQEDELSRYFLFLERLRQAELQGECGLSATAALRWAEEQRREEWSRMGESREKGSEAAVFLSTIHAAKGLEFPMVILPYLDWRAKVEHDFVLGRIQLQRSLGAEARSFPVLGLRLAEDFGSGSSGKRQRSYLQFLINEEELRESLCEERRVFYVGASRAREALVFSLPRAFPARQGEGVCPPPQPLEMLKKIKESKSFFGELAGSISPAHWLSSLFGGSE